MDTGSPDSNQVTQVFNKLRTLTPNKIRAMQVGGNGNARSFFQNHDCNTRDIKDKYNSRTAMMYRNKLQSLVTAALQNWDGHLHIDSSTQVTSSSPPNTGDDFWSDMHNMKVSADTVPSLSSLSRLQEVEVKPGEPGTTSLSSGSSMSTKKVSSLGSKKPGGKKGGLGGVQKSRMDFAKVESDAQKAFDLKEQLIVGPSSKAPVTEEESEVYFESVNLAYKDLANQQKETEKKMQAIDPQKAAQMQRLGMGFQSVTSNRSVSHSGFAEDIIIEQAGPTVSKSRGRDYDSNYGSTFDDLDGLGSDFSTSKKSTSKASSFDDDLFADITRSGNKTEVIDLPPTDSFKSGRNDRSSSNKPTSSSSYSLSSSGAAASTDAQSKFGSAKSISSTQFFGQDNEPSYEEKSRLAQFSGQASLSSDEYFGRDTARSSRSGSGAAAAAMAGSNLYDIKEGVKEGVTKVGARLSHMASDMMSSLQDKYGY